MGIVSTYISYRTNKSISHYPPLPTINDTVDNIIGDLNYITTWHDTGAPYGCTLIIPGLYYVTELTMEQTHAFKSTSFIPIDGPTTQLGGDNWGVDVKTPPSDTVVNALQTVIQSGKKALVVGSIELLYAYFNKFHRNSYPYLPVAHGLEPPATSPMRK